MKNIDNITLDNYYNNFINQKVKTGKFSTKSEVIITALKMMEVEDTKNKELIKELEKGENFGF